MRITTAQSRGDCEQAGALFDRVWAMRGMVPNEVIIATVHAGGYASLAWLGDQVVGASWGFLGVHQDEHTLHSHVTGVVADHNSRGVGEALKQHQWSWAHERGIAAITWSFDPLVRRNAYFNMVKLGARVTDYHEDFYGSINDGLNQGEHTDRLLVRWDVAGCDGVAPVGRRVAEAEWSIMTPPDIEALRRNDRAAAAQWRISQRADLRRMVASNHSIAGMMIDGSYAVRPT